MRQTIRGLRAIEREALAAQRPRAPLHPPEIGPAEDQREETAPTEARPKAVASDVVPDYCAATRGILNDDQGGPLHPPGLRMAEALGEIHASLQRNLEAQKGGLGTTASCVWPDTSTGG
jgi:hypothetical protein